MIRITLTNPTMVISAGGTESGGDLAATVGDGVGFHAARVRLGGDQIAIGDGDEWSGVIDIITSGGEARYVASVPDGRGEFRRIVYQTIHIDSAD
jgi:hypothetical protein